MNVFEGIFLATSEDTGLSRLPASFTGDLLGPWLVMMNLEPGAAVLRGVAPMVGSRMLRTEGLRECVLFVF